MEDKVEAVYQAILKVDIPQVRPSRGPRRVKTPSSSARSEDDLRFEGGEGVEPRSHLGRKRKRAISGAAERPKHPTYA